MLLSVFVKYNIAKFLIVTEAIWKKSSDWILYTLTYGVRFS